MRKTTKSEEVSQPWKEKEKRRNEHLLKMQHLCDALDGKARISRKVRVNDDTNPLLLVSSVKYGTIVGRVVSPGGLHQLLILWDGSRVPIPEMPDLLEESW